MLITINHMLFKIIFTQGIMILHEVSSFGGLILNGYMQIKVGILEVYHFYTTLCGFISLTEGYKVTTTCRFQVGDSGWYTCFIL